VSRYRAGSDETRIDRWQPSALGSDRALQPHAPLFEKLNEAVIEAEQQRLKSQWSPT
jgi:hypothetical protein